MIYLNQAGTSWPKPPAVLDAVAGAHAEPPDSWDVGIARDHARVARALGVPDASRLLITPGCTGAIHVGIADHPWQPGDRIVTSQLEHRAVTRPAALLAALGVEHVVVPRTPDACFDLESFELALREAPVRLVAVTAACNVTGELLPVREIIELAHAHGALCLIDAAQTAGWIAIDVERLGPDLLAFAGHKGPQGPRGVGALYVAPHVSMTPPSASRGVATGKVRATMPDYCDVGSIDRPALAGLAAGLDWMSDRAGGALMHARRLAEQLIARLQEGSGFTIHGAGPPRARMPTVAITHALRSPAELARGLRERGIVASAGRQCATLAHESLGTRSDGVLRLSFGPRSGDDHAGEAASALVEIAG